MKSVRKNGCEASPVAVVLAGGLSKRFGSDKAYAKLNEKFLIQMIVEKLVKAGFEIVFSVAKLKPIPPFESIPIIEDILPFEGPLQALFGALAQLNAPRILFVACDMPLLNPKIIRRLWEESRGADLTVLEFKGKVYPLPGVYTKPIIPYAKELLRQGKRDLKSLLNWGKVKVIRWADWEGLDPEAKSLFNANTKEALREATKICPPC